MLSGETRRHFERKSHQLIFALNDLADVLATLLRATHLPIVTGQGLGSSSLGLGQRGQLGSARFGQAGAQVFVNAANGNLLLQGRDQRLAGTRHDAELLRAYNSQVSGVAMLKRSSQDHVARRYRLLPWPLLRRRDCSVSLHAKAASAQLPLGKL